MPETFREFCSGVCNVHSKLKHSKPTVGYGCFLYTQSRQQAEHMPQRNMKEEQKGNIKGGAFPCMTKNLKNLLAANSLSLCLIGVVRAVL
jgi:hypothetical protein